MQGRHGCVRACVTGVGVHGLGGCTANCLQVEQQQVADQACRGCSRHVGAAPCRSMLPHCRFNAAPRRSMPYKGSLVMGAAKDTEWLPVACTAALWPAGLSIHPLPHRVVTHLSAFIHLCTKEA